METIFNLRILTYAYRRSRTANLNRFKTLAHCWIILVFMTLIAIPTNAAILAAGGAHSLAVSDDGTVWAWGYNGNGQLGDAMVNQSSTPIMVSKLSDIAEVAANFASSSALRSDGTVWHWGGISHTKNQPVSITMVKDLEDIKAIAMGQTTNIALRNDGTVWTWPNSSTRQSPVRQIPGLTETAGITANSASFLAYDYDCNLWAWGKNNFGQLGNGDKIDQQKPIQILSTCLTAASIDNHAVVLQADGTLMTWGYNRNGQLGDNSRSNSLRPKIINDIDHIIAISTDQHTLALRADGTVWAWGANAYGQLGIGNQIDQTNPVQVVGLASVEAIAAGDMFSLAEKSDGTVWAWGRNNFGQLGDGTTEDKNTPVQVADFEGYGLLNLHMSSGKKDQDRGLPPVFFQTSPPTGMAPLLVTFTPIFKISKEVNSIEWDFGDGDISNQKSPQHLYTAPGTYIVTMSVSYANNIYRESLKKIVVKASW